MSTPKTGPSLGRHLGVFGGPTPPPRGNEENVFQVRLGGEGERRCEEGPAPSPPRRGGGHATTECEQTDVWSAKALLQGPVSVASIELPAAGQTTMSKPTTEDVSSTHPSMKFSSMAAAISSNNIVTRGSVICRTHAATKPSSRRRRRTRGRRGNRLQREACARPSKCCRPWLHPARRMGGAEGD